MSINFSKYLLCHLLANSELKLPEDALIDNIYFNKTTQNYQCLQIFIADI